MLARLRNWLSTRQRTRALRMHAIGDALWNDTVARLPCLAALDPPSRARLREAATLFLADKTFSAAHGLALTDEICVVIAAQAALPVLSLGLELYRGWLGVVVYPGEFLIRKTVEDEAGVVHDVVQEASGEAWEGGPVILSWEDVRLTAEGAPYNVVIHEFAHKIDMLTGEADGHPPFFSRWHGALDRQAWQRDFDAAYARFGAAVDRVPRRDWRRFERDSLIDPYAAEHPSEFFAVGSEVLFTCPHELRDEYPDLYRLLASYYLQDPAACIPTQAADFLS
jgi:Mlc titration factor MtfA (ptsG expression regulator)